MWPHPVVNVLTSGAATHAGGAGSGPEMDRLAVFGFLAAFATLVCLLNRNVSKSFRVSLAVCIGATAAYAFLRGAWPVGVVQMAWATSTLRELLRAVPGHEARSKASAGSRPGRGFIEAPPSEPERESRLERLFGTN